MYKFYASLFSLIEQWYPIDTAIKEEIMTKSPLAIRCLKSAFNPELDGQAGIQELSGNATLLYYLSEEGDEGRAAWNEKRAPNFRKFPWLP